MKKLNPNLALIAFLFVGGYFAFGNDILKALGVKKSAEKKQSEDSLNKQEVKYNFWAGIAAMKIAVGSKKTIKLLTASDANILAKRIYNAWGVFNDNEEALYAVFRELRYQSQVASLVDAYRSLYKLDLLGALKSKLNDKELAEVIHIISIKPTGIENIK